MTAKAKRKKPRKASLPCMMVIRVSVPRRYVSSMKVAAVYGAVPGGGYMHKLEILSAYYDLPFQPNARD